MLGILSGQGDPVVPIGGARIEAVASTCPDTTASTSCPPLATTWSLASGGFALTLPNGTYFLFSANTTEWGGAWASVTVFGGAPLVLLTAYPYAPYSSTVFVLPDWNNLSLYASNCNAQLPCQPGVYGTQVPLTAWTQDGVFYVNASLELVFYSFANRTVYPIAPWVALYDNIMSYDGIENTEWLTADGSYVYEFGCLTRCQRGSNLTIYAVNITTGRAVGRSLVGTNATALLANGQVDLIGVNGNHSLVAVTDQKGLVHGYDLWSGEEMLLGQLPFFEANNLYWIPPLNSYIDVEAAGSYGDRIAQVEFLGEQVGSAFAITYSGTYASAYRSNGVDGVYFNTTSRELAVTESTVTGSLITQYFGVDPSGTITGVVQRVAGTTLGKWPNDTAPPNVFADEHRSMVTASTPALMGFWDGRFYNNSFLVDPSTGTYLSSNLTLDRAQDLNTSYHENHLNAAATDSLYANSSYFVVPESVDCRRNGTACALRGTAPGTTPGTVVWAWRSSLTEFPVPATASLAQTLPPGPVPVSVTAFPTSVRLDWGAPANGADPLLNYTVFYSEGSAGPFRSVDLAPTTHTYTIRHLLPSTPIEYRLEATNLHWHNAGTNGSVETAPSDGPVVTGFTATPSLLEVGSTLVLNVTLAEWQSDVSYAYSGLPPGCVTTNSSELTCPPSTAGTYDVVVTAENATGLSTPWAAQVVIVPALALGPVNVPAALDRGIEGTFAASVAAPGVLPDTYRWEFGAGPTVIGPLALWTPNGSGPVSIHLQVTDGAGRAVTFVENMTVGDYLRVQLGASTLTIPAGQHVALRAQTTGGTAPFSYVWASSGGSVAGGGNATFLARAPGLYRVNVSVGDAAGALATGALSITVYPRVERVSLWTFASPWSVGAAVFVVGSILGALAVVAWGTRRGRT